MRKGGGTHKGSNYERHICVQLSLWVTQGLRGDVFWRTALSGGRATVAHRKGNLVDQVGDIVAVAPEGHVLCDRFFIELKHYKDLDFDAFFLKGSGRLTKFWKTALREAVKHKRDPILIARQNRVSDIVITRPGQWTAFLGKAPAGMSIQVKRPEYTCEVRYFEDLLKTPFNVRNP